MQFSDILASSIHDIKNSLSMVLSTLDDVLDDPRTQVADPRQVNALRFEALKANNHLIQLLTLYRMDKGELSPNIMQHSVDDLLEELVAHYEVLMQALDVECSYACDASQSGFYDDNLVSGVLSSAIGNAVRYTQAKILLSAREDDGYLVFSVEDDGEGYPDFMLQAGASLNQGEKAFRTGSTQLGLFFASQVACLHQDAKQRQGFIRLSNGGQLPGGCFELWLP